MIEPYKNRARISAIMFIVLNLVALLVFARNPLWFRFVGFGKLIYLIIWISAVSWYYNFAKAKGYSGLWGFLGLFHLIGFVIILLLPNKTKQN